MDDSSIVAGCMRMMIMTPMARQIITIMKSGNNNEDTRHLHSTVAISYLPIYGGHLECYCSETYYGMSKDDMHTCVGITVIFDLKS